MPSTLSFAAALLLPLVLASSSPHSNPHVERHLNDRQSRHRELARQLNEGVQLPSAKRASGQLDPSPPLGGFKIVGDSGVSAQMMFLGTENTVFILDKTENNSLTVTGADGNPRPAWGTSYDLRTNLATPMTVTSNTFCAGGFPLANGSWAVFGGNQPVTYQGVAVVDKGANPSGANPYQNSAGGEAIRMLTPCDGGECEYAEGGAALTMTGKRWYPTVEGLSDGSVIVIGGDENGGYVSTKVQNNPTYEFWPDQSPAIGMSFLDETVPLNLFPLTWLMPSGKLFMQAAYRTIMYDLGTKQESSLPDMPYAVRVYPASAATVMLPLTPENNYTPTLLFCGGSSAPFEKSSDGGSGFNVTAIPADDSCVRISPEDANPTYTDDDRLPEPRSMGNFIYLPDGTLWLGNGVGMGTAGYGDEHWSFGQSYGQSPVYDSVIYNPKAPAGSRFSREGLTPSGQERMYHSTALLLTDGAILVSGSNPNKDVTFEKWGTSYEVEKFYPLWYSKPRPVPSALPDSLSYGGDYWNLTYTPINKQSDPSNTKVVVIRTGFSTHGMNFGQKFLELAASYTQMQETGEVTMHVSQMPPNSNIFQPGPALVFLVVDGVPSIGKRVTIGTGQIGSQAAVAASILPGSSVIVPGQETITNATESQTVAAGLAATAVAINREGSGSRVSAGLALPLFAIPLALVTMVSLL